MNLKEVIAKLENQLSRLEKCRDEMGDGYSGIKEYYNGKIEAYHTIILLLEKVK